MVQTNEKIITVRNLWKKFGSFAANADLTFDVYRGEIFGFLGANGAGKTTAMKILCGLSRPTLGKAIVNGFDANTQQEQIKKNIGYMSQKFSLYADLNTIENIRFYGGIYGLSKKKIKQRTEELLSLLNMEKQKEKLIADLPLGWRQKIAIAVAMVHEPEIIFLDEPTGGVDPITRRQFWDLIYGASKQGVTVFVTTHYMDEAEYCDRVSIMVDGRIDALDSPEALKKKFMVTSMDDVFVKLARKSTIVN